MSTAGSPGRVAAITPLSGSVDLIDGGPQDASPVPSPCIGVCSLDKHSVCTGCWRTLDEIAAWGHADDDVKRLIWTRLPGRMPAV